MAKRDALFRNPTLEGAKALMTEPPEGWASPDTPLAAVHKGRLQWIKATDAMLAESKRWLIAHGYLPEFFGFPPYTPETRDAERAQRGLPPLKSEGPPKG